MTRQVSRGSAGEYQADDQAGVAGLSWRVSGKTPAGLIAFCGLQRLAGILKESLCSVFIAFWLKGAFYLGQVERTSHSLQPYKMSFVNTLLGVERMS